MQKSSLIGKWVPEKAIMCASAQVEASSSKFLTKAVIELNEDGTAQVVWGSGCMMDMLWNNADNVVEIANDKQAIRFSVENGRLVGDYQIVKIMFARV